MDLYRTVVFMNSKLTRVIFYSSKKTFLIESKYILYKTYVKTNIFSILSLKTEMCLTYFPLLISETTYESGIFTTNNTHR